jgi:hypothetical protein
MELFLNWFFAIALFLPVFATVFFCNRKHTAIRVQSHCGKVAITHMLVLQLSFLQSQHISGCNHIVKDVAITYIVTRLQLHQANTNLVAI